MAKKIRIKRDYRQSTDAKLLQKAHKVSAGMTGNPRFPNPVPTLTDFNTGIQKLESAANDAQHGDRIRILLRNESREELVGLMDSMADYAVVASKGDRTAMSTTGFTLTKEQHEASELGEIKNFKAEQGANSGEADMTLDRVKDAKFYLLLYMEGVATEDTPGWLHDGDTKPLVSIANLKPATLYSMYVKAFGAHKQRTKSKIITRMFL